MARASAVEVVDCPHIECQVCGFVENEYRGVTRVWVTVSTSVLSPGGNDDGPSKLVCSKRCFKSAVAAMADEIRFEPLRRTKAK